jgi:hypothetical protein
MLACLRSAMLAPKPLAVDQVGAGEVDRDASPGEPLQGLPVEAIGGLALTGEGPRTRLDPDRPVRAAGLCPLGEALDGGGCDVGPVTTGGRFDQRGLPIPASPRSTSTLP